MLRVACPIATVVVLLVAAPAARAQDVTRLPLGSAISDLVTAPDGGAWIAYETAQGRERIGRVSPDGRVRSVAGAVSDGALGPDGQAWFSNQRSELVRVDGDLRIARTPIPRRFIGPFAIGTDGTLWTPSYDGRMAHIRADGQVSYTPAPLPEECTAPGTEQSELHEMVRASDGAMWITDFGCDRLLRVAAGTTTAIAAHVTSFASLTADPSGGVWFAPAERGATHVDVSGAVRTARLALGEVSDIAAGADGTAWFAHEGCRLTRIDAGGGVTEVAVPVVTHRLAVDASGRLLLAGVTRLARYTPGTPPAHATTKGRRCGCARRAAGSRWRPCAAASGSRSASVPSCSSSRFTSIGATPCRGTSNRVPGDGASRRGRRRCATASAPRECAATRGGSPRAGGRVSCSASPRSTSTATKPPSPANCA